MSSKVELELIAKTEEAIKNLQKAQSSIEGIGQGGIKATDDLRSIGGDMKGLAKDLAGDFAKVAGVVTGSAALVKKAMDFGAEAATIDQTAQSFDGLIQRARVSTDLLEQLDAAALGTVDDMTLMSSTLTLVAGTSGELQQELLEATPQLMEIAKAANKLNPTLGDTAHMYESLATGIKRASPMILDNLGLTIKVGEANEQYAASIGKTVEELSAEEKQLALLSAALTAGDTLIAQVGGTTDSSADSFAAMEANIKNAGDALKMEFLPILSDAATGLNTMLSSLGLTDTVQQHAEDVSKTAGSYEEYAAEIERAANAAGMYVNNTGDLINMHGAMVEKGYQLSQAEFEAAQGMAALEAQAKQTAEATSENLQRMKKEGLDPAGRTVGDILGGLQQIDGMSVEATVTINTIGGGVPAAAGPAYTPSSRGSGWGGSGRAAGGPVFGGQSYLVGELGPEIVTMGGSGNVTPSRQIGDNSDIVAALEKLSSQVANLAPQIGREVVQGVSIA